MAEERKVETGTTQTTAPIGVERGFMGVFRAAVKRDRGGSRRIFGNAERHSGARRNENGERLIQKTFAQR
ncbi:MAG: hypothetical protein M3R11_04365 [Acidobacteriota bacterium]|nr:hypothetical protein [Acidobacteriota bacterium]